MLVSSSYPDRQAHLPSPAHWLLLEKQSESCLHTSPILPVITTHASPGTLEIVWTMQSSNVLDLQQDRSLFFSQSRPFLFSERMALSTNKNTLTCGYMKVGVYYKSEGRKEMTNLCMYYLCWTARIRSCTRILVSQASHNVPLGLSIHYHSSMPHHSMLEYSFFSRWILNRYWFPVNMG